MSEHKCKKCGHSHEGKVCLNGDLIPTKNGKYSIGSDHKRIREINVSKTVNIENAIQKNLLLELKKI